MIREQTLLPAMGAAEGKMMLHLLLSTICAYSEGFL